MRRVPPHVITFVIGLMLALAVLASPGTAGAGIYPAGNDTVYKEYWISHSEFTGGCNADGSPTNPSGASYIEPSKENQCPKTLRFNLPDDFSSAEKIEIYVDLWKNHAGATARFRLNDGPTIYAPPRGFDWSRSPYVAEINRAELRQGQNTITFWGNLKYHVHDVSFRIYHNAGQPLRPGPGSDVTPPDGRLLTIADDNGEVSAGAGGVLSVNGDKLTLKADVSGDAKFVEFHAWYEGYDEDNDGVWRDWHNLGRNNWHPGGRAEQPLGGTIDHIGTRAVANGAVSVDWNLPHITNQGAIKFKIRVVDAAGNVRDAAGGESAVFKLIRNRPVIAAYIPGFLNAGIHMDGIRPQSVSYNFSLPASLPIFDNGYLLGNYWRRPRFSTNNSTPAGVFPSGADDWEIGIVPLRMSSLLPGQNTITYSYTGGIGHFIESPGPMFVLRRTTSYNDSKAPSVSGQSPAPGATNVNVRTNITARIADDEFGVDFTTIKMEVNGQDVTSRLKLDGLSSAYTINYVPPQDLPFNSTVNVTLRACDLKGNCIAPLTYSFQTQAVDNTPPKITNVVVTPTSNGAKVTWKTDEPANSRVDYGLTNAYELGNVSDAALLIDHEIKLTGLAADTRYYFRVVSEDQFGNKGQTSGDTFRTAKAVDKSSDDFNSCTLDTSLWQWVDPVGDASYFLNGQTLEISVPAGVRHNIWGGGNFAPRIMQPSANIDFEIEAKFESPVTMPTQMQGIVVEEDGRNFIRLSFEARDTGPTLFVGTVLDDKGKKVMERSLGPVSAPMYLKLRRVGSEWRVSYSFDGVNYQFVGKFNAGLAVTKVGVFAGNMAPTAGATPAHKAVVDYFFNTAAPIDPEDGKPIGVNVSVVGNGTVVKSPDKAGYACGEQVTLSAAGSPGWSFDSWSGDASGADLVTTLTVDGPKNVIAAFTQDQYTLNVNTVNNGRGGAGNGVIKNPDQPSYVYGNVVTLTASPEPGWFFVGWAGALSGSEISKQLTMYKSESVTATFEQEQYTFAVKVVNDGVGEGGAVTYTPAQERYVYGDVITLTAEAVPGWTFGGWSGDASGSDATTTVTVKGDTEVIATFVQDKYTLTVNVINDGVGQGGQVSVSPAQDSYLYGEQVTLVAVANPGWTFTAWGGALSGSNPAQSLTMTGDTTVSATFVQDQYDLEIDVNGEGAVKVEPQKGAYVYGDVVTLTATPAPNRYFGGWSGDLVGAANPAQYTIVGDTRITALFTDNPPPVVESIPDKTTRFGRSLSFTVRAEDANGSSITLRAEGLPRGAQFVDNRDGTGRFSWTPGMGDRGEHVIVFIASDGEGVGSASVKITVTGYGAALAVIVGP